MKKNLLVAQSGGPTAAINATLAGVIEKALENPDIDKVYGAHHGIQGVLSQNFIDIEEKLSELSSDYGDTKYSKLLDKLSKTPAAALGSCRYKLSDPDVDSREFDTIIDIFRNNNISYFIYIGGNDSMDTVMKLSRYLDYKGIDDIYIVGAPKTIDNDLYNIDHCPGFGSAAKYIVSTLSELERELLVYDTEYVIIVEIMGRNAGWLTASASLAEGRNSDVPYLLYLSEIPFNFSSFISDIKEKMKTHRQVIVAVSEGIMDESGKMICDYTSAPIDMDEYSTLDDSASDDSLDAFGHKIASGAAKILEECVKHEIGCKSRSIELNLLQRCAGHLLSETDIQESRKLGYNAANLASSGMSGVMSSLKRLEGDDYKVEYTHVDINDVANREKRVPIEWINSDRNNVTNECKKYLSPLIVGELNSDFKDGIPDYVVLI